MTENKPRVNTLVLSGSDLSSYINIIKSFASHLDVLGALMQSVETEENSDELEDTNLFREMRTKDDFDIKLMK